MGGSPGERGCEFFFRTKAGLAGSATVGVAGLLFPPGPTIGCQIVCEYSYAYVAVYPKHGQMSSLILPWVDAKLMSLFLAQTAAQFPDEHYVMLLDGA